MLSSLNDNYIKKLESDLSQGNLKWIITKPSNELIFLDIPVKPNPSTCKITTKTYKKAQNLHSYLPANNAHAPEVLKV